MRMRSLGTVVHRCAWISVTLIGCTRPSTHTSDLTTAPTLRITNAECYAIAYSDPVGSASPQLFPTAIALLPGADAGSATGMHGPRLTDLDWAGINEYAGWKKLSPDSLEVTFRGHAEGIRIHASRANRTLTGRATWLSDLVGGGPPPSLRLVGTTEECPNNIIPAGR